MGESSFRCGEHTRPRVFPQAPRLRARILRKLQRIWVCGQTLAAGRRQLHARRVRSPSQPNG